MELGEVRSRFAAYASGGLTEADLRKAIRAALVEEPMLSTDFVALADAYRRANVIDDHLQSSIVADITDVTGPPAANLPHFNALTSTPAWPPEQDNARPSASIPGALSAAREASPSSA